MKMKKLVLAAVLGLITSFVSAKLPVVVQRAINEDAQNCRSSGGRFSYSKAIQTIDLNGDGYPDYVYDSGETVCAGGADLGGSGGWPVTVFAGQPDGSAKEAFSNGAIGARMINGRLYLGVGGAYCGQNTRGRVRAQYDNCIRPLQWNARRKVFEFAPVSQKRPFPASWER